MYSFGVSLYKREYEYIDYTQDQLGGSMTLGREFYRHFHASAGVGYVDNQSTINDADTTLINYYIYNDQYKKSSFFASISFDNTDDFYTPREGMKASVNFEYAQLDGDDFNASIYPGGYADIIKPSVKIGLYYGLEDWIDYDLIMRIKGRATYIDRDEYEKLPIAERLFMGGISSVRGFDP